MKCKKCGNELKLTDKFCPECGEKIEPKNISECPICHEPINSGCIICPNCKNNIHTYKDTSPLSMEDVPNKNNTKFIIIAVVCFIAIVLGIVLVANSCTDSTKKETDFEPTTATSSSELYNDSFWEYDFDNIVYSVPDSWEYNSDDELDCFYIDDSNNMLIVDQSDLEDEVNEELLDVFVEALDTQFDNYSAISNGKVVIGNGTGRNKRFTFSVDDVYYYGNFYVFYYENKIFTFEFMSEGYSQCSEFNAYEEKIIDSIAISKSTEKPTSKPTEPPTEKPTEKPTERKIINNTSTDGFWAEGSGDYVATGLKVTGYGVLHIEYYGEGNFSVISYENDDYDNLLVNEIGNYNGDVLIDHSGTFELEISAEGSWKITSSGLSVDDKTSFSGTGDCVTGLTSHSGGTWEISHNGDDNFAVVEYGLNYGYMDLLVNEIGNYNGTVKAESGDDIFFKVSADGAWSIKKK